VVGGGEGVGKVYKIARAIAKAHLNAQIVLVAGRNKRLRRRLEKVTWEIPTTVFGFVTNMPELMGASDVIVTKAGPGTISEALITGLPILLSGFIPGQEEGNVEYVIDRGVGTWAEKPQLIASTLARWLQPENKTLIQMAQKAQKLGRPQAALDIAAEIYSLAQASSSSPVHHLDSQRFNRKGAQSALTEYYQSDQDPRLKRGSHDRGKRYGRDIDRERRRWNKVSGVNSNRRPPPESGR
jgi:predicted glycosyltransferase